MQHITQTVWKRHEDAVVQNPLYVAISRQSLQAAADNMDSATTWKAGNRECRSLQACQKTGAVNKFDPYRREKQMYAHKNEHGDVTLANNAGNDVLQGVAFTLATANLLSLT